MRPRAPVGRRNGKPPEKPAPALRAGPGAMQFQKAGRYAHASTCGKYHIPAALVCGNVVFSAVAGNAIIHTARAAQADRAGRDAAWRECAEACDAHANRKPYGNGTGYGHGFPVEP